MHALLCYYDNKVIIMVSSVLSIGLLGIDSFLITVEADLSRGLPAFDIVGLPDG